MDAVYTAHKLYLNKVDYKNKKRAKHLFMVLTLELSVLKINDL